jgi:hypothetical protein
VLACEAAIRDVGNWIKRRASRRRGAYTTYNIHIYQQYTTLRIFFRNIAFFFTTFLFIQHTATVTMGGRLAGKNAIVTGAAG